MTKFKNNKFLPGQQKQYPLRFPLGALLTAQDNRPTTNPAQTETDDHDQ